MNIKKTYMKTLNSIQNVCSLKDSGKPSINFMRDGLGNLQDVTIKYKSTIEQTGINAGRFAFLKEILKTIAEPNSNHSAAYQCNNPTNQEIITGRK